uniref:Uncharacterized protein n=1 Tax=Plectus sambesii TaxID=2011161 RepID=A0A914W0L3_9BILA
MKTNIILLLNAFVMFIVSFATDYWMYRGHDLDSLVPQLRSMGCNVSGWDGTFAWQKVVIVECRLAALSNAAYEHAAFEGSKVDEQRVVAHEYLFSEYGNLYRECNDLLDGERLRLSTLDLLYRPSCHYYVTSGGRWHSFRDSALVRGTEEVNLVLGCMAMATLFAGVVLGIYAYITRSLNSVLATGVSLCATVVLYLGAVIGFLVKLQLVNRNSESEESSIENPTSSHVERLVKEYRVTELSWSFVAAIICLMLTATAAYLYLASSKAIRDRRKHLLRRRQLQAALMTSCRQEVALAIRAKMTVI